MLVVLRLGTARVLSEHLEEKGALLAIEELQEQQVRGSLKFSLFKSFNEKWEIPS